MVGGKSTLEIIIAAKDRTKAAFTKVNAQMKGLEKLGSKLTKTFANVAKAGALIGGAAVIAAVAGSTKAFMDFEDAMANVRKTTGFSKDAIKVLGDEINALALRIPVAQTELAGIAAIAGQLGIQGKDNILSFTEDVAKMSTAFDMSAESAATAMAKMSNIYDIPIEQASALGSAINVLGNTTAAQESAIMDFSMSLGASAKQLGFSATEAVSMGASLISMGMDASDAGTRLNASFTQMGKKVGEVAAFLDLTEKEFKAAFGADPMAMMTKIIGKLSKIKDPLERNTAAAELFGAIGAKAINGLGGNLEGLQTNLANAAAGFEENTSLSEEFAAKTDTLKAKFELLKNSLTSLLIDIGGELAPSIQTIIDGLRKITPAAKEVLQEIGTGFKEAFESISRQVAPALAPFAEKVEEAGKKLTEGFDFKMIMDDIGVFIGAGLRPLIDALGWVIDKLGPLWDALNAVGEAFHFLADELRTAEGRLDNLRDAQEELNKTLKAGMDDVNAMAASLESVTKAPVAILKDWKKALDAFDAGAGSYRDALAAINVEITKQKDLWAIASKEERVWIDENLRRLNKEKKALEERNKIASEHLDIIIQGTDKAIEKTKEFIVTIGDTTIEFKGAAAEVVKNADAYEKLQKSAQSLIDLDWSVFTEFEAALPNIEAGIGNMESSFVGLKDILEDNIGSLENVQQSVMDISEIAAPFLEEGFLDGIKAIGSFAGSLKAAGSAIGDFSSLQDVSIEGCINFSMHVQDMVSALEILESQMEDLVPSFDKMNSLIDGVKTGFISGIDITALYGDEWEGLQKKFGGVSQDWEYTYKAWAAHYGLTVEQIKLLKKEGDLATFAFMKQTSALRTQTEQLVEITDALQPYLNFMRTLNELAALSTLSTEELNNGLNSINDTLVNLGSALSTFDLRPVMESLFGEKKGTTNEFTKTMKDYEGKFSILVGHVDRFSTSILILVNSFEALANISKSVLADQTKLKEVFESITTVMTNFSTEMGGAEGFAQKFADGMDAMLESAEPLMEYFQDNKEAIKQFNSSLRDFSATITNIINVFEDLASAVKRSSELVVVSTEDMEAALALIPAQLGEIAVFLGRDLWGNIVKGLSAVDFSWKTYAKTVDDSMPAFTSAMDTFSTLISKILGLSSALKDMRDMSVLSVRDIDEALKNIPVFLDRFVDALALNMYDIKQSLKDLDKEWALHAEEMEATMPSYEDSTSQIGKLVGSLLSLHSALESLSEKGTISGREFDKGFTSLMASISNFAGSLSRNMDALIASLWSLSSVWQANKSVLVPLMDTFMTVTYSFWQIANNANAMAESFRDVQKNSGSLEKGFKSLIEFINRVVEGTKEFYTAEAADELATYIEDVGKVITAFVDLDIELKNAMNKISDAVSDAVEDMKTDVKSISDINDSMYINGQNTLQSFINGLIDKEPALITQMGVIGGIIKDYLGVESPTKLGPLQKIEEWPQNLIRSFSLGLESEMHTLNSSFAALAPGMGAGSISGGNKNVNLYITQNISDRDTADYANRGIERLLSRHSVM